MFVLLPSKGFLSVQIFPFTTSLLWFLQRIPGTGGGGNLKANDSSQVLMGQLFSSKAILVVFRPSGVSGSRHRVSRMWTGKPHVLDLNPGFTRYCPHHFSKLLNHSY